MQNAELPASRVIPGMVDSHVHTTALEERGIDVITLLDQLAVAGLGPILDVAIRPDLLARMERLSGGYRGGSARSSGLHPSQASSTDWQAMMSLVEEHARDGRIRAIGETGLDWYRMYAPRERQIEVFEAHLSIARAHSLPVVVHNRDADADCLKLLRAAGVRGVMHCFSSQPEQVAPFLDAGMYLSFAGNLTFKSAGHLREAVQLVPADRLLFETDCPWLAPHPYRGRPNHPGLVGHTIEVAAQARGVRAEDLAEATGQNFSAFLQES